MALEYIAQQAPAGARHLKEAAHQAAQEHMKGLQPLLDFELLHVSGYTLTVGATIAALLVLLGTALLSALAARSFGRYGESHPDANRASLYTLTRLSHYLLLFLGALLALSVAGVPVGKMSIFAGGIGVGLGFGLQTIFSNFVSGLILLFDKSLRVGDFVELANGVHGEVRGIRIRYTRITTNDNIDILVPNSDFITGSVTNWTLGDGMRRMRVPFSVASGTDKERVKEAALEAAASVSFTLTGHDGRKAQVWLTCFGERSVDFELIVWLTPHATKHPAAVKAAYLWALHDAMQRHAIQVPFPTLDLNLRSAFGLEGAQAARLFRPEADARLIAQAASAEPEADRLHHPVQAINDAQGEVERGIKESKAAALNAPADNRAADSSRDPG